LLGRHAVEGAGVFDLQIVATMLANGVQRMYTFNPEDFQVLAALTVVAATQQAGTARGQETIPGTLFLPDPLGARSLSREAGVGMSFTGATRSPDSSRRT
jgi:hypothetical protein